MSKPSTLYNSLLQKYITTTKKLIKTQPRDKPKIGVTIIQKPPAEMNKGTRNSFFNATMHGVITLADYLYQNR